MVSQPITDGPVLFYKKADNTYGQIAAPAADDYILRASTDDFTLVSTSTLPTVSSLTLVGMVAIMLTTASDGSTSTYVRQTFTSPHTQSLLL